jgi:PLP dependent protein
MADAAARLHEVTGRIAAAAQAADRATDDDALVAVSKTFEAAEIVPVLDAGQRVFGENRVQEAAGKWPALKERFAGIELHLIGPLQSNKARDAVALFDAVHALDRPSLAEALRREIDRAGRSPRLFVQVNTGAEAQKAGVRPEDAERFVADCRETHGLAIDGLMCIPPAEENAGPHFALLGKMARDMGLALLSMGMSGDYEKAIAFGATHVRVGSAIFGTRPPLTP